MDQPGPGETDSCNASCLDELTSRMRLDGHPRRSWTAWRPLSTRRRQPSARKCRRKASPRNGSERPHRRAAGDEHGVGGRGCAAAGADGRWQASRRPRRSTSRPPAVSVVPSPGLVCTVFNWARPRDLSHYETFEHYHATFYKHVEALSVTPFRLGSDQSRTNGAAGLLRPAPGDRVQFQQAGQPDRPEPSLCEGGHRDDRAAGRIGGQQG